MDFDAYERRLWAGRATAYERGFARLTAHTAGALLDAAGVEAGTRVLDVGTGPGVVAGAAAARGARVTAVDAEPSMATVTRIKDEFDRLVARYAVDAGQVALPAVAVLGSGQRAADRAG